MPENQLLGIEVERRATGGADGRPSMATLLEGLKAPQVVAAASVFPNWFEVTARANFAVQLAPQGPARRLSALQIGAFTGDASVWLLENVLTHPESLLTDVDTWAGSDEAVHHEFNWSDVEGTYDRKISAYGSKVRKCKGTSDAFFAALDPDELFDVVYVDGDHTARQTLIDGFNAFDHTRVGGIIAFDDYTWHSGEGVFFDPAMGVNAFLGIHEPYLEVLAVNAQLWVRKVGAPRG